VRILWTADGTSRKRGLLSSFRKASRIEVATIPEGYAIRIASLPRAKSLVPVGRVLSIAVFAILSLIFLSSLNRFPYYSPVTNVEEVALYYTSAQNFLKYGFGNSGWLPDYSTSLDPEDHPYVYNHMPPGPDIFIALLLKASSGSYVVVRIVFWLLFLSGVLCYFRFLAVILERLDLKGAGYAVIFLSPLSVLQTMDDPQYAMFLLLTFAPLLALTSYYRSGARWLLGIALGVGLLSSVYLDYLSLSVVIYCWIFLWLTGLVRLDTRHMCAFLVIVALGVALHLFQNLLYLGPVLFVQELGMTLGNRTVGVPTKAELKGFYESIGLVHHGSTALNPWALLVQIGRLFVFPGFLIVALAGLGYLVWTTTQRISRAGSGVLMIVDRETATAISYFSALSVWIAGTLTFPMLTFPALTQEYGLTGTSVHLFFVAIVAVAVVLYLIRQVARQWSSANGWVIVGLLVIIVVTGIGLRLVIRWDIKQWRQALSAFQTFRNAQLNDIRADFAGQVFMTNINPVIVGFFAQTAGHGVCELASLPVTGDIDVSKCHVSYMRRREHYAHVRPRYFIFTRQLMPGFSECLPSNITPFLQRGGDDCLNSIHDRLLERFQRVYINDVFEVFDLHMAKRKPTESR
jgi:hypothetical protein